MGKAMWRGVVVLAVVTGGWGSVFAGEGVIGLPAPRDPDRPGAVMLHGGGDITRDAFARFVELAGGERARVVIVPSAGYRRADYDSQGQFADALTRRFSSWVRLAATGRIKSCEFLATDNPEDADDPAFVRPLTTATGVWFSGGRQPRLNYRYVGPFPRQTRFQAALRDVVARGGVVGGTSAGMAALPQIMTLYQDYDGPDERLGVVAAHGLGVFDGAIVEQHFDGREGRLERFTGLLRDAARLDDLAGRPGVGSRLLGLAVDGSTALVAQSDRLEVHGAGAAHVFIKSLDGRAITWYTVLPGDKARLQRDAGGQITLLTAP